MDYSRGGLREAWVGCDRGGAKRPRGAPPTAAVGAPVAGGYVEVEWQATTVPVHNRVIEHAALDTALDFRPSGAHGYIRRRRWGAPLGETDVLIDTDRLLRDNELYAIAGSIAATRTEQERLTALGRASSASCMAEARDALKEVLYRAGTWERP